MAAQHPMLENIRSLSGPALWEHSMQLAKTALAAWLKGKRPGFERVVFVGHGSSLYNGQVGKYIVEHIAGIPAEAIPAFAFATYGEAKILGPKTLVVGISTTGGTQSVVDALARARAANSPTLVITAHAGSAVTSDADAVILTGAEKDMLSVKTSSYVLALVPIYMLALSLAGADESAWAKWQAQITEAGAGAARLLASQHGEIRSLAGTFSAAARIFVVGSGPNIGTAGELSLKIIEMAKMYTEAQELEDFFHGRLREMDQVNPMILIAPSGRASRRVLDFLTVMKQVNAPSIVLTDMITPGIQQLATHILKIPSVLDEFATPLLYIIPLHLFSFELALARGQDPNAPSHEIVAHTVRYEGPE
jgi:glucosamine 6-phosphate synthetase-like amidotransferase/phosphosugar isomerase protein